MPVKSKSTSLQGRRRRSAAGRVAKKKQYGLDGLNRREVAILSHIPLAAVDKAIEQKVLPRRRVKNDTRIESEGVALLTILHDAQLELPVKTKLLVRNWVLDAKPHRKAGNQELELSSVIAIRCPPAARERVREADKYIRLRDKFIEVDPDIRGGTPVLAGTRMGVHALAQRVESGDTLDILAEEYPDVPREAFEVALRYAAARPLRGRPKKPWLKSSRAKGK